MKKEDEKDIALANFIESLIKSKLMRNFFQKSNKMIAGSYIVKRKIKKIFFEVISNSKIFNIIFFQRNCQRPRFSQNYRGGTRQRGGTGQRRIRYSRTIFFSISLWSVEGKCFVWFVFNLIKYKSYKLKFIDKN